MKKLTLFTILGLALFISGCADNANKNINVNQDNAIQPIVLDLDVNTNINSNENLNEPANIGGDCQYNSIAGTAKILSINQVPDNEYNCPQNPKIIKFQFTPNDPSAKNNYKFPNTGDISDIKINAGMNPSLKWINANNITVGKIYQAERLEITAGTCAPVSFKFSEIDLFPKTGCN